MIKFLALVTLVAIETMIFVAAVVFEEPPAFIAYTFGFLNGASVIGLGALHVIRRQADD